MTGESEHPELTTYVRKLWENEPPLSPQEREVIAAVLSPRDNPTHPLIPPEGR